jgi:hypothetical protein
MQSIAMLTRTVFWFQVSSVSVVGVCWAFSQSASQGQIQSYLLGIVATHRPTGHGASSTVAILEGITTKYLIARNILALLI